MNGIKLKINIKNLLIMTIVFLSVLLLIFYADSTMENILLIGITLVLVLLLMIETGNFMTKKVFLLICLNACSILITLLFFEGAGSGLLIFDIVLAIILFNNVVIDKKLYMLIHIVYAISAILFIMQVNLDTIASGFVWGERIKLNSNSVGIVALAALFHICCVVRYIKKNWIRKIAYVISIAYFTYIVALSNSRSSLLALVMFYILVFFVRNEIPYKKYKKLIIIVLVLSLFFPLIYIQLYNIVGQSTFLGKNLFSGRQFIWRDAINYIKQYPIFGSGNEFAYNLGNNLLTETSHNMLIGVWKAFGILPTVTFISMIVNDAVLKYKGVVFFRDKVTQLVFLASMLIAYGESFLTDCHFCFLYLSFLLMNLKVEGKK